MHDPEVVTMPLASTTAPTEANERLRVIHVDRKRLLERANAEQRRCRREIDEECRHRNRRSSWLFRRTKRPREEAIEPPSLFTNNVVLSAKYSAWNFGPRVLLAQMQRPSNVYFLFIAFLQTIKEVSNTRGIPTILLPLAVVLVCSAIKEALEDRERHRADRVANSRPVMTLTPLGSWEERRWGDLRVGDVVKVMQDQTIPADLFLLSVNAVGHGGDEENQQHNQATNPERCHGSNGATKMTDSLITTSEHVQGTQSFSKQQLGESNIAYIETKSLDGETNLKIRTAIPLVAGLCGRSNPNTHTIDGGGHNDLCGTMVCEQPNNRIATFEGTFSAVFSPAQAQTVDFVTAKTSQLASTLSAASLLQFKTNGDGLTRVRIPVTAKQMLLRSCVLRNTRSVTGMVVFTGHETKVYCSNTERVVKTSSVERRLNRLIIGIVILQQLICFLAALLGAYWMHDMGASFWYLDRAANQRHQNLPVASSFHPLAELAKLHLRYFIIMQNFVPISLNVSLEFVKYWQAYFIEQDLEIYDKQSDTPAVVRSSALNEDLGRVHHIFTDKTGTLTMNLMLFRYFMVGGKHYGGIIHERDIEGESYNESTQAVDTGEGPRFVDFDPTELFADILAGGEHAETLRRFLRHLALCHTLIPTKSFAEMCSTSFPEYSASSPDEQALVSAAAFCNVRFVHRTPTTMTLLEPGRTVPSTYKLLNVIEFDSDRKRMSVIVETPDGSIELLCKGADDVIFERLAPDQATKPDGLACESASDQLTLYAQAGMRTLCLAYKTIDRQKYEDWNARYVQAHASMEELVKRRQGCVNAIDPLMNEIEADLVLLGVTAVQDKLQAGVPATLRLLQETNIKLWTLTGDKMETAVNIGYASALLSHDMNVQEIKGSDYACIAAALKKVSKLEMADFYQLPFRASHSTRSKASENKVRLARKDKHQTFVQNTGLLESAKAKVSGFLFGTVPKQKQKRRRHRTRDEFRVSSPFRQTLTYSSVATDADYSDNLSSNEDFSNSVGHEANVGTLCTPAYGSLSELDESHPQNKVLSQKLALVIDGQALEYALQPQLRNLFYQVTRQCASAVICCRVSPKQKADIVELVRDFEPDSVTLAIGDGANDVAMIQAAHIGVGISGQEGAQAVNASDYALAQFRFLQKLLFVHGRWAYRRVAKLMSYMLYKNVTYVLTTFWFGCFCGFSGQPLILDIAAQSFNVLYTSVPLVLFAVLDQDVSSTSATKFPYLYALGQKNVLLARRVFWPWILNGIWHSIVILFVSVWAFAGFGLSIHTLPVIAAESGKSSGLVTLGFVVFTNLVIVVNFKLCLEAFMLTWPFLLTVTGSILLWFAVGTLISLPNTGFPQATGEMEYLQELSTFWLVCLLVLSLSLLRDILWKLVRRFLLPSMYHILQERELLGLPNSPRRMQREHQRFTLNLACSDGPDTVVDYGNLCKNVSRLESHEELLMRASPLGERLIASCASSGDDTIDPEHVTDFQGREKKRNIRIRGSFQSPSVLNSFEAGAMPSFQELPTSNFVTGSANAVGGSRSSPLVGVAGSYRGYAFSEDENVDSDVESASLRTGHGEEDQAKALFGAHVSIKKVLKSVRGRKNA